MKEIMEGLQILLKYCDGASADFSAEHDRVWCSPDNAEEMMKNMSGQDLDRLSELGWYIDEELDCWTHFC